MTKLLFRILLVSAVVFVCDTLSGQSPVFGPGPVGMDTMSFADVYVIRQAGGPFPDYWFAVGQTPESGISAHIYPGTIHCIRTKRFGKNFWWTAAKESSILTLTTEPDHDYYVMLSVSTSDQGEPLPQLSLLDDSTGKSLLNAFEGSVQYRYCELPFGADANFAADAFGDTVRWYGDDQHYYKFDRLPAWDIYLRSPLRATVGFRNQLVSATFSETGGIDQLPKKKFGSKEEFDEYLQDDLRVLLNTTWGVSRDRVEVWESVSAQAVPWAKYSAVLYSEVTDKKVPESAGSGPLTIRTAMVVFFWQPENESKGHSAILYTSERGISSELHSKDQMLERIEHLLRHFELRHMTKIK
jgi:hypothetical protein